MTDTDDLLDTVAGHIEWLRRPSAVTAAARRVDNLHSADYLERLRVEVERLQAAASAARDWFDNPNGGDPDSNGVMALLDTALGRATTTPPEIET